MGDTPENLHVIVMSRNFEWNNGRVQMTVWYTAGVLFGEATVPQVLHGSAHRVAHMPVYTAGA